MARRRTPLERAASRFTPSDTSGMDPEMAATIDEEAKRRAKVRMVTSGGNKAATSVGRVIERIKEALGGKKK